MENNEKSLIKKLGSLFEGLKNKKGQGEEAVNKKSRFTFAWKALTVFLALLIFYTAYHVFFGLSEDLESTHAGLVEQKSSVVLKGVIFREEEGIKTNNKGDMRPYYYDGERVSVDTAVATVYSRSGNSDANEKIAELEEKLDVLKRSNISGLVSIVDIESVKNDIDNLYSSMMLALSQGDPLRAARAEKELTVAMNKLAVCQGRVKNYNAEIAQIESELDGLYSSFKGEGELIFADKGGYFYHSCDGYEDTLTLEALASLSCASLEELIEDVKDEPIKASGYTAKFVYDNVWRIAVICDVATAQTLEQGEIYDCEFFDIRVRTLKLTLEEIREAEGEESVLIFACSDIPEGFDFTRYQEFKLDVTSLEGYRVPKEAIETVKDKETGEKLIGVYILDESTVRFKRVEIIGETDGYYIVAKRDRSKENYADYLNLNDLIILGTNGLYDGKVFNK